MKYELNQEIGIKAKITKVFSNFKGDVVYEVLPTINDKPIPWFEDELENVIFKVEPKVWRDGADDEPCVHKCKSVITFGKDGSKFIIWSPQEMEYLSIEEWNDYWPHVYWLYRDEFPMPSIPEPKMSHWKFVEWRYSFAVFRHDETGRIMEIATTPEDRERK